VFKCSFCCWEGTFLQIKGYVSAILVLQLILCAELLQPFFVTNDEPMETWEFMNCIMEAMGCQRYFSLPLGPSLLFEVKS
jgi:hypothetical protein